MEKSKSKVTVDESDLSSDATDASTMSDISVP